MNLFWEAQGEITPPNFAQHTIQMGFRVFLKILRSLLLNALQERFTTAFASPRWGIKKSKRGGACGENSLASRIELAGKVSIVLISLPVVQQLLDIAKDMMG